MTGLKLISKPNRLDFWLALLAGAAALALYVTTLAPGLLGGDAGELQFVPYILGLVHVSGYPLQTLLDKLWITLFPLGAVAWRTNLLSAIAAAGGVAGVYHTVKRNGGYHTAGLVAALSLAVTTVYWSQAVLADKYALNGLFSAGLLALSYRFYWRRDARSLLLLAVASGLAMAHHRSLLIFFPFLVLLVLWCGRPLLRRPVIWFQTAAGGLLPLLFYLYLPWAAVRELPPARTTGMTFSHFIRYVFLAGGAGQINFTPQADGMSLYFTTFQTNFPLWLVLLAFAGLVIGWWLVPPKRFWLGFVAGSFFLLAYLAANYQNFDLPRRYVYFVPSYVCAAVLIGEGVNGLLIALKQLTAGRRLISPEWVGLVALAPLLIALPGQWQTQWAMQRAEQPLDIWRQTLKSGGLADRLAAGLKLVPPNAVVVSDWEAATPLWYVQWVDGVCPTCDIWQEVKYMEAYRREAQEADRPLYISRTLNQAATWSDPTAVGPLVYLANSPAFELPAGLTPLNFTFDDRILLAGYSFPLSVPEFKSGKVIPLSLYWQRTGEAAPDYAISWRLYGPAGIIWQADNPAPVLGMHPFSLFESGQVVADYYEIPIPLDSAPGAYELRLLLYQHTADGGFANAAARDASGQAVGEEVTVLRW